MGLACDAILQEENPILFLLPPRVKSNGLASLALPLKRESRTLGGAEII